MTSDELLNAFRLQVDDLEEPYLWSDEEIYEYMNDAQNQFCRWTEGIADSRTESVCRIVLSAGTAWYPTSPKIREIRTIRRTDTGEEMLVLNPERLRDHGVRLDSKTGIPKVLIVGLTENFLRVYPVPDVNTPTITYELDLFRLPLTDITEGFQTLEINPQHHIHLLDWMKYRAYSKQDADTFNAQQAATAYTTFRAYCDQAFVEVERARYQPTPIAYGGI